MKNKVIFVDIDETICFYSDTDASTPAGGRKYETAVPDYENIMKINELYDSGNTIVYWTARGSRTGIDWRELTQRQLNEWGAKFHELRLDKPYYDLFIEDKSKRIEEVK